MSTATPTSPDMSRVYDGVLISMAALLMAKLELGSQDAELETAYAGLQRYLDRLVSLRKLDSLPSTGEAV